MVEFKELSKRYIFCKAFVRFEKALLWVKVGFCLDSARFEVGLKKGW